MTEKNSLSEDKPVKGLDFSVTDGKLNDVDVGSSIGRPTTSKESTVPSVARRDSEKQSHVESEKLKLAAAENKAVGCLRVVVLLVLLIVAICMSVAVFVYTDRDEAEDFENGFSNAAARLIDSFHSSVERQLGAIGAMSITITAHALASNQTFPFVILNDFELQAAHTRVAAETVAVQWAPVLKDDDQRKQWELYAFQNRFHIDEAFLKDQKYRADQDIEYGLVDNIPKDEGKRVLFAMRELAEVENSTYSVDTIEDLYKLPDLLDDETGYHPKVWNVRTGVAEEQGVAPYVVTWQRSPVNGLKQKFMNLNIAQAPALEGGIVEAVLETGRVSINKAIVPVYNSVAQFNANLLIGQYRESFEEYALDPVSFVAYPVFDSFEDDAEIQGMVVSNLYWRLHFTDLLAENDIGYICVLTNSFGQSLRYRVDGAEATFLGEGPHSDSSYNDMVLHADVNTYVQERASVRTRAYKRARLDQDFSRYTLSVYPSGDTEAEYKSNKPAIYSALVAIAFFLTTAIFMVYDLLIAKRQKIVMDRALQSGLIVASLYPEQVRDRIYEETQLETSKPKNGEWNISASMREVPLEKRANAAVFSHTTVLFADLKGFTAWSSTREPFQVFHLLETLYSAFDELAEGRSVFKIETIGDCYVSSLWCTDTDMPTPMSILTQ